MKRVWVLAFLTLWVGWGRGSAQNEPAPVSPPAEQTEAQIDAPAEAGSSGELAVQAAVYGLKEPDSATPEIKKAQDLSKAGDMNGAKELFRQMLLKSNASSEEACLRLAQIYFSENNDTDCLTLCDKGLRQFAGASMAQFCCILGDLRTREGKKEEALLAYLRVALVFTKSRFHAEAQYKAASVFEELGQRDRAMAIRGELLQMHPSSPWAEKTKSGSPETPDGSPQEGVEDVSTGGL